ncbi:MAG: hypothetical protein JJ896_07945 [Rhodothermales bacterium]|nr:hypothetical protein [Rhodothermales bacterium]MBO6779572.1 hypothetical protein [Rhodothermales bacterium]
MMRKARTSPLRRVASAALAAVVLYAVAPGESTAQRPIRVFDPFYHDESPRRGFFDGYAVTGELIYRPTGLLQGGAVTGPAGDALGVNLRVEYELSDRVDVGMYLDATNTGVGSAPSLRWLTLQYYRMDEFTDYAIRFAVDPIAHGVSGFPQMDLAFLYGSPFSPGVRTDYALGVRRVQIGVQELITRTSPTVDPSDPTPTPPPESRSVLRTQAFGWEVHMSGRYSIVFDPAGSSLYVSLLGQGGSYDLVEWDIEAPEERSSSDFNGGVIWSRIGLQFDRPSFRFGPYVSVPLRQWAPSGEYPRLQTRVGFRLTFR